MELSYHKIDLAVCEEREQPPADLVKKERAGEVWYSAFGPVDPDEKKDVDFRVIRKEEHVYVPMFPYLVKNHPTDAFGFLFQLGFKAAAQVPGVARRLHLAIGEPTDQVQNSETQEIFWRFFLGVAVAVK